MGPSSCNRAPNATMMATTNVSSGATDFMTGIATVLTAGRNSMTKYINRWSSKTSKSLIMFG